MRRLLNLSLTLMAFAVAGTFAGCETGVPGVENVAGDIKTVIDAKPSEVMEAAEATVKELKLYLIYSGSTELDGQLVARTATDRKVTIKARRRVENVSEVVIRVGAMGDEAISLQILEGIKSKLAAKTR